MTPDLGLTLVAGAVVAFAFGLGAFVLHTPRCPRCRRPGVGEAREIADTHPYLVEVVYRCLACDGVVGRRMLGHPGD